MPCNPPPVPGVLWPSGLTWGAAGAADPMLGLVVLLFPVLARLVLRVVWGRLQGEMEVGGELSRGHQGRAEGLEGGLPRPRFPSRVCPHPPVRAPPSSVGPGMLPGDCRGPGRVAPRPGRRGRRPTAGAWRPVGQSARWVEAWGVGGRPARPGQWWQRPPPSPGSGTRLGLTCPWGRAPGPGLASRAPRAGLRKWEWSKPASGRGQGALGAEAAVAIGEEEQAWPPRCRAGGGGREST